MLQTSGSRSMADLKDLTAAKATHDGKVFDYRIGLHKSVTPLGQVFHHVGTFTPMTEMQMPQHTRPGHKGPWRSYGTWWQSLQKEDEKERNVFHKDECASRYWPLGKNVQKVHGSLQPEHYFMGYRARTSSDPPPGTLAQASNSLWMVKNAYVERMEDPPMRRTIK
ncbi:unnamed protein product [Amoebophrya sp. A120]|nr:unnamed protein product [Amoebophrya sp. A120]|eukprot:GSA120T00024986001.1